MKKFLLKAFMLLCLILWGGVSSAWAADETLTISGASSGHNAPWGTSYGDGSGTSTTSESNSIGITYKQTARMSTAIQIAKNTANGFYSTTVPTQKVIKSITITSKTNSVNLHVSTDGETWTSADNISSTTTRSYSIDDAYKYFKVTATSSYAQITSITVTYMSDGSDKTALATPTNLSATNVTDKSAQLNWDAVDGASDYTVSYKTAEGNWISVNPAPTTNSCTIEGLYYNTQYNWKVSANPTNTTTYKSSSSASDSFTTLDFITTAGTYNVCPNNAFWGKPTQDGAQSVTANTTFGPVVEYGMTFEMNSKTSTNSYMKSDHSRVYNGYTLTITAPTGYNFTAINFTGSTWVAPTANVGTMNSKSWTGAANEVIFSFSGTSYMSKIELTYNATTPFSVTAAGYATFFDAEKAVILPTGLKGFVWNDGLEEMYDGDDKDNIVPAGEPIVVKANEGAYTLTYTTSTGESYKANDMNDLCGAATDMTAAQMEDANPGSKFYALSLNAAGETSSVGFYWVEDNGAAFGISAGKAYLALPAGTQARSGYAFNEETNAIATIGTDAEQTVTYNLNGMRVDDNAKGFVIRNGKKCVVK